MLECDTGQQSAYELTAWNWLYIWCMRGCTLQVSQSIPITSYRALHPVLSTMHQEQTVRTSMHTGTLLGVFNRNQACAHCQSSTEQLRHSFKLKLNVSLAEVLYIDTFILLCTHNPVWNLYEITLHICAVQCSAQRRKHCRCMSKNWCLYASPSIRISKFIIMSLMTQNL